MTYMKNLIILLLFTLISCGKHDTPSTTTVPANNVPPVVTSTTANTNFTTYKNAFLSLATANNYTLTSTTVIIMYEASYVGTGILGSCTTGGGTTPTVRMNPQYWDSNTIFTNSRRAILMYHELGHCLLGLGHDDSTITTADGHTVMKSLMSTYELSRSIFENNYTYYTSELFDSSYSVAVYFNGTSAFPSGLFASAIKTYTVTVEGEEIEGTTGVKFEQ